MTTLLPGPGDTGTEPAHTSSGAGPGRASRLRAALRAPVTWWRALQHTLHRPLAVYYLLLGAAGLLLTLGLLMVLSASSVYSYNVHDRDSYAVVTRQLTWVAVGLPCAYVASRLPLRAVRWLAWPALLVAVVLLALTATPLGTEVNGNTNWLALGPLRVQPSEIAKLAVVLWAAHVYALKERRLGELSHVLVPVVPMLLLVTGIVVWQRDLGTALVLAAILLGMLWVVGAPARLFAIAIAVVSSLALWLASTSAERRKRLLNFTDPFADYHDAGWQPAHGLYALSSGGVFGQGIGASQQKWGYLPEAHTDYIFAVLGEELGLVGTLLVLALFATIAYAAVRIAATTDEPFVRYVSFGIVVWLLGQTFINLGMVLALLPVIGIPLPLISYGGSALLPSLVALGLLIGFARRQPEAARALAQRRGAPAGTAGAAGERR